MILGADFGEDDYSNLPGFIRVLISIFRTSIGDIQAYNYGAWKDKDQKSDLEQTILAQSDDYNDDFKRAQPFAILIIWITWYINIFFMVIILANFLIAEISVTFEDVKNLGNVFLNTEKAKFNQLIFQIEAFFGRRNEFSVMVFTQDKDFIENPTLDKNSLQMIDVIKKNTQAQIQQLFNDIMVLLGRKQKSAQNQNQNQDIIQDIVSEQVQELKNEINEMKKDQTEMQKNIVQIGICQEKIVIEMLEKLTLQRQEDSKLLKKLSQFHQQSNSQSLRAKEFSFDEDPTNILKNATIKIDSKDLYKNQPQSASKYGYQQYKDNNNQ